jgi:glutamate-5-semialdehyde dehydrogenase
MTTLEKSLSSVNEAAIILRNTPGKVIQAALKALAKAVEEHTPKLLLANKKDLALQSPDDPKRDRLLLTEERLRNIAASINQIARLPEPGGKTIEKKLLPNGLKLEKQLVPLGTVAAIYESRPNVTFDIAALCLRSKNGCVLKGSKEAHHTNKAAARLIAKVLAEHGLPVNCVMLMSPERAVVGELLNSQKYIDVIIPRGSDSLIRYVRENSRVPVIETGAGVCHVYVESSANLDKALEIVVNSKVSRPSVCNSMDTLIVDKKIARAFFKKLAPRFEKYKIEVHADATAYGLLKKYPFVHKAAEDDFAREWLSLACSVKVVDDFDEALAHIRKFSTRHSEAIVSMNKSLSERFLREVDAAAVYSNASTRFTDGEQFGLGAEIGISTQKLHARGPFALEKLVTEKWIVRGTGQIRE